MIKERQKKAKLLIQHFKHVKEDAAHTKYERQKSVTVEVCALLLLF